MKYSLKYSGFLSDGCGGEDPDEATIKFDATSDKEAIKLAIEKVEMISLNITIENSFCMHYIRSLSVSNSKNKLISKVK